MKIAIISDVLYPFSMGGSEIRSYEVAKRLVKMGHDVHIFGIKYWKGGDIMELEGVIHHGICENHKIYDENGKRKGSTAILLSFLLFVELLKERFDILDVQSFIFTNCYVAKFISILKRETLVFTWHQYFGRYFFGYFGRGMGTIAFFLEYLSIRLARGNIAVSDHVRCELADRGLDEKRIAVIETGADIKEIRSVPQKDKIYDLIFVGRLTYQKNLSLLIETVGSLVKNLPNIKVCIVGDGDEMNALVEKAAKMGLSSHFDFLGRENDRQKVYSLMKQSRIFVFTSILEGLPLTAVEANACGIPIVSVKTEWNDIDDYLKKNGESGMTTSPDAGNLAEAVADLLKDKVKLDRFGKNGYEKAVEYDWDEVARKTERYYSVL
jgi:glycosyltransferase involved in cell wall biosynthesis